MCPTCGLVLANPVQGNAVDLHSVGGGVMIKNRERSAFPSANHYQGQLQTPQSVTVLPFVCCRTGRCKKSTNGMIAVFSTFQEQL
jgi:hypothetical protein